MVRRVLPGLMLVMLLGALDQTAMAAALPSVAADLGRFDLMPAVMTAYLLAATAVMPFYGKLGDRIGRKPVLLAAIVVFVLGAVLCATATSMPELLVWRVVQGTGGGGLMIGAQAVLGEIVSPRERGRYLGLLGVAYAVAVVGGPVLGGLAVDHLTWRWVFAVHPPLGLLALVVVARTLRLPPPPLRPPLDVSGAALLALSVTGVVLLGSGAGALAPAVAVATVLAAGGWLLTARRAADPVLPLRLFRTRSVTIPAAVSVLIGFALFGTITYLPAYLQVSRGVPATQAGLVVTALMAGVLVTTVISARLITRTGRYKVFPVAGTATAATGTALLGTIGPATPLSLVIAALLLVGLGVGLVMQVLVLVAQNGAAHRDLGVATSAVTFLRQIGASAGVAVTGAVITSRFAAGLPAGTDPAVAGGLDPARLAELPVAVRDAFGTAVPPVFQLVTPLLVLALVLTVALPAHPLRDTAHVDEPAEGRA